MKWNRNKLRYVAKIFSRAASPRVSRPPNPIAPCSPPVVSAPISHDSAGARRGEGLHRRQKTPPEFSSRLAISHPSYGSFCDHFETQTIFGPSSSNQHGVAKIIHPSPKTSSLTSNNSVVLSGRGSRAEQPTNPRPQHETLEWRRGRPRGRGGWLFTLCERGARPLPPLSSALFLPMCLITFD